jgi:GT2 family glycosyltransferase
MNIQPVADGTGRSPLGSVQAVVVSFDSGPEILRLCDAVLAEADGLIIVDNGSSPTLMRTLRHLADAQPARVQLIANDDNRGLAAAQNQGIEAAFRRGADWVLLLDDDSVPRPGMLAAFADALAAARDPQRVALLAAAILQPEAAGQTRYWTMRGKWRVARRRLGSAVEEDAIFAIASGSLVRNEAIKSLGGLREDFFIDYVDVEFGLRLKRAGWRILVVPRAMLEHRLGNPTRHAFGAWSFKSTNHDAARRFTIFRNRARLWRAYGFARPGWVLADAAAAAADLMRILCFEADKPAKLGRALCGLWLGLRAPPLDP